MSLSQTREIVDQMIDDGLLRELSAEECCKFKNFYPGYAFILKDPASIPMGDLE